MPRGRDGAIGAPASPLPTPRAAEVHLFVDQRITRLELGSLKDLDDQHC